MSFSFLNIKPEKYKNNKHNKSLESYLTISNNKMYAVKNRKSICYLLI